MKKGLVLFCLVITFIFFAGCTASIQGKPDTSVNMTPRMISTGTADNFEEIAQMVTPAVVGISAIFGNVESVGSGVALSSNGYILTMIMWSMEQIK